MPFSTTTLVRFTAKLSRCLSLALLPALATEARAAVVGQPQRKQNVRSAQPGAATPKAGALPYLAALGPLPLRFARPGPEPTDEPPASPEPKPVAVIEPPAAKEKPAPTPEAKPEATPPPVNVAPAHPEHSAESPPEFSEPPRPPLPILPDDTKRELRAEDVLPFFIYPNRTSNPNEADVRVIGPIINTDQSQSVPIPPSSATYQQK